MRDALGQREARALLLSMGALWAVLLAMVPTQWDDLHFLQEWEGCRDSLWQSAYTIWMSDNGRVSNLASMLALGLLPRWAWGLLGGLSAFLLFRYVMRLSFERGQITWRTAALTGLICTLFLPWYNNIVLTPYWCGYVFGTVGALWLIYRMAAGGRLFWWDIALAVLAGAWHEGFTVPVCCGLLMAFLCVRRWRTGRFWWLFLPYALGVLSVLTSPSWWTRAGAQGEIHAAVGGGSLLIYLCVAGALALITLFVPLVRSLRGDAVGVTLYTVVVISMILGVATRFSPRGFFLADACAVILWMRALRPLRWRVLRPLCYGGVVVVVLVMFSSIIVQARMRKAHAQILSEMEGVRRPVALFIDTPTAPWYTLGIPATTTWRNAEQQIYYPGVSVLPADLRRVERAQMRRLGGNAGVYAYRGHLLIDANHELALRKYRFGTEWGVTLSLNASAIPFRTADGASYTLLEPRVTLPYTSVDTLP